MSILEVSHLKKVYTTRFGGQKVEALSDVSMVMARGKLDEHPRVKRIP